MRKSPFSTTTLSFDANSPANPRDYLHKPYTVRNYVLGYILVADSMWVALQILEQFCPKAGNANPLVFEPEQILTQNSYIHIHIHIHSQAP